MTKSTIKASKKRRGRPATGQGETIGVRIHKPLLAKIDAWIDEQPSEVSRPEAIRRLTEKALGDD